jgi:hypothetical protein
MSWEIESHHVDLAEMVHETVFVESSMQTRDGRPVRHVLQILLGADGVSSTRGFGSGNLTLEADGTLRDPDGKEVTPADLHKSMLERLNNLHHRGRAFAKKHGAKLLDCQRPAVNGKVQGPHTDATGTLRHAGGQIVMSPDKAKQG